jgi:hypothetical protein
MTKARKWFAPAAYLLLLMAVATVVWERGAFWAGGSDSSGYFNSTRLLLKAEAREPVRIPEGFDTTQVLPWVFDPLGMRPIGQPPALAPSYTVGLPLHLAAGLLFFGEGVGPHLVLTAIAVFAIAATLWLLRLCGVGPLWTLLSGVLLASNSVFLSMALTPMSDVLALAWCALAFCFALKSRTNTYWALACGLAIGVAVLVRPSNYLMGLPVLFLLGIDVRRLGMVFLGGFPIALFLSFYNLALYGSPFDSSYGYDEVENYFSLSYVLPTLKHFALWLGRTSGWWMVLTLPGLIFGRTPARLRLALGAWVVVFVAFYSTVKFSHQEWWYLRYILPAYPPLLVGAALCVESLAHWTSSTTQRFAKMAEVAVPLAVFAISLTISINWTREQGATSNAEAERVYPESADWIKKHLPPQAVIVCMQLSGALYYFSHYPILRYDRLTQSQWAYVRDWRRMRNEPLYAVLFPFEYREWISPGVAGFKALGSIIPGDWVQVGNVQDVLIYRLKD